MTSFLRRLNKHGKEPHDTSPASEEEQPSTSSTPLDPSKMTVENPSGESDTSENGSHQSEPRQSLWKVLSSKLGMDVTSMISLPVSYFEPLTVLQRHAEMLHFASLLNKAADLKSPLDRMAYVAIFAVTGYNGTERLWKPFNPVIGETYEYIDKENGYRMLAEQVSHHPPCSAAYAYNEKFMWWQESAPVSKFLGNSLDLDTQGKTHVYFPQSKDHFVFTCPTSRIHNLIIGKMWIDHFGNMDIRNLRTKDTCHLHFEKCGWLGKCRHEVTGYVKDSHGNATHYVHGRWTEKMFVRTLVDGLKEPKDVDVVLFERPRPNAFGKYSFTEFALRLNVEMDSKYRKLLPATDSRLRPDRLALENGDLSEASNNKHKMEERQRVDRKSREKTGQRWQPRWFKQIYDEDIGSVYWMYTGDYWEQRSKKEELLKDPNVPEEALDAYLDNGIKGLACDFRAFSSTLSPK